MSKQRATKITGFVAWFNEAKGYGEIISPSGESFFFSYRELVQNKKHRTIDKDRYAEFVASEELSFGMRKAIQVRALPQRRLTKPTQKTNRSKNATYEEEILGLRKPGRSKEIR